MPARGAAMDRAGALTLIPIASNHDNTRHDKEVEREIEGHKAANNSHWLNQCGFGPDMSISILTLTPEKPVRFREM